MLLSKYQQRAIDMVQKWKGIRVEDKEGFLVALSDEDLEVIEGVLDIAVFSTVLPGPPYPSV